MYILFAVPHIQGSEEMKSLHRKYFNGLFVGVKSYWCISSHAENQNQDSAGINIDLM